METTRRELHDALRRLLWVSGAAWLLAISRRFLFADSGRANGERRMKLRRERRDDWRLDA